MDGLGRADRTAPARLHALPGRLLHEGRRPGEDLEGRSGGGPRGPGTVLDAKGALTVACGEGALRCLVLQKPGKPKTESGPFLQSLPFAVGEVLA